MNGATAETRAIVVEREFPHPPEKVWRALTQPHLMEDWLMMKADFKPEKGHRFNLTADWGTLDCKVQTVEPHRKLAYSWGDHDLKSVVTWTLTATAAGTNLRMEQVGFRQDQPRYYGGAKAGWPRFFDNLEHVLVGLE